jgi:membrane protease YdiL (CAAX protease family)
MKRFLLLLVAGVLIYFVGGYWNGIPPSSRTWIKVSLTAILLLNTIIIHRSKAREHWRKLTVGLLAASTGFLVSWFLSDPILEALGVGTDSPSGIALTKFLESTLIVAPILVVAKIGGLTRSDLFLQWGKRKVWLIIGIASFLTCALLFIVQGGDQALAWAPWALVFVLSNGFMEELHFRGLLLRPFESLIGRNGANLCIALFFTLAHVGVTYTPEIAPFLAVLIVLALVWGYVIQKTDALWGSVLFHAGADLLIVVGIFQTYGASP